MIKGNAFKASLCATALALSFSYGSITAEAATCTSDKGIAGITPVLDTYFNIVADKEASEAEELLQTLSQGDAAATKLDQETTKEAGKESKEKSSKVESPYANLGISIANENSYVNIRKEPNTESEIVGKLYPGCAADILETEGEWVKIHSGKVDGYIKSEFLAIGEEAEKLIDKVATKYVTVNTQTLRVREGQGTDTDIVALIPEGEKYYVVNEYEEWIEILIDLDDEDGNEKQITGFVSRELVIPGVEFKYAISIEEERAKLEAEERARKAEEERLERLAQEQEEKRRNEEAKKAAAQSAAQKTEKSRNESASSNSNSNSSSYADSSTGSGTGSDMANYALNFVGNPYVYGGTSLTSGADCSGFVQSIYAHFGYSIPRTSSSQSQSAGREVSLNSLQPGDLIFYCNSSGNVSHVALYIGGGKVVHASNRRDGIKVSNIDYRTPYKARRIVN